MCEQFGGGSLLKNKVDLYLRRFSNVEMSYNMRNKNLNTFYYVVNLQSNETIIFAKNA